MIGSVLETLCVSLNGGNNIDETTLNSLLNIGKTILEGERDWMVLRKTDTSITVASSSIWQTAHSISTITDFLKFYGKTPIAITDGLNKTDYYRQVPFEKRLQYKDVDGTFVYDVKNKNIYFNGKVNTAGTMYLNYIVNTGDIDVGIDTDIETLGVFPFPSRFHPILAFYAIGISKGAIDYDSINREMLPQNSAVLISLKNAMDKWDTDMGLSSVDEYDPNLNANEGIGFNRINLNG